MRAMIKFLIFIAVAYLILCLGAFLFQRRLIFLPARDAVPDPATLRLDAERVEITVSESVTLVGWWARNGDSPYTLLWCHGNAGNVLYRAEEFGDLVKGGLNVLLFDYRGYGASTGSPSVEGINLDAVGAYDYLISQGVEGRFIVPYGRSIGSGPAAYLANRRETAGLVLVQPLTGTLQMGRRSFPFLPVGLLLREIIDNETEVARFDGPLLIVHGDADNIVPFAMGKRLFEVCPSRQKTFVPLKGGDHNGIGFTHGAELIRALRDFLASLPGD